MRRRRVDLAERIDLLTRAVDLSEGRIPDDVGVQARAVVERADQRCRIGGGPVGLAQRSSPSPHG